MPGADDAENNGKWFFLTDFLAKFLKRLLQKHAETCKLLIEPYTNSRVQIYFSAEVAFPARPSSRRSTQDEQIDLDYDEESNHGGSIEATVSFS